MPENNIKRVMYLIGGIIILGIVLSQLIEMDFKDEFNNILEALVKNRKIKM